MDLAALDISLLLAVGFVAGALGGMLGLGGSILMIPGLTIVFAGRDWADQHLYQAAAMLVNVAVAVPAARRHHKKGAVRWDLYKRMLPIVIVSMVLGILAADRMDDDLLRRMFAIFLTFTALQMAFNAVHKPHRNEDPSRALTTTPRVTTVAGAMGLSSGLLGIGGGSIAVLLANRLCRLPLRSAIALSSAIICITATIGGIMKVALLHTDGTHLSAPLLLVACLAPTGIIGAHIGAGLTHKIPIRPLTLVFALTLIAGAIRMWR